MMKKTLLAAAAIVVLSASISRAAEAPAAPAHDWSFSGIFGTLDRPSVQRGFQVYREVCANCHSMKFVAYRNLADIGFTPDQIQEIAAEYEIEDCCTDDGDPFEREAKPADRFVSPFPNEQAARAANNGALPPDLSLMVKARPDGANYLYHLLLGYKEEPPEGVELMEGMYYNEYFPGHQIAMAPQLYDGLVDFEDGTEATQQRLAEDVVTFLAWTASPELEERKNMGVKVILFLIVLTALMYALKRKIWSDLH